MNCIVKWYLIHKRKELIIEALKLFSLKVCGCTGKFWDRHDRFFSNIARKFSQASHCALNFSQVWLSRYPFSGLQFQQLNDPLNVFATNSLKISGWLPIKTI